jgi:hypothetical protein
MRTFRFLLCVVDFALLAVGVLFFLVLSKAQRPGPTLANYSKLCDRMSVEDVESFLGSASSHLEIPLEDDLLELRLEFSNMGTHPLSFPQVWVGDAAVILVWFDEGRLYDKRLFPRSSFKPTLLDYLGSLFS